MTSMTNLTNRLLIVLVVFLAGISAAHAANLEVSGLKVSVSYPQPYDRYSDRDDADEMANGEQIEADIYPGSIVEFKFDVTNTFSASQDIDIDSIIATINVKDLDDGDDVEKDGKEFDLEAQEDEEVRISIPIPTKVDAMEYDVKIVIEGENNVSNERLEINLKMDVKKDSHDIKIISYSITPNVVSCDRSVIARATIANLGENEETNAGFEVRSADLDILKKEEGIELDEDPFHDDNERSMSFPLTIAQSVKAGDYPIEFRALYLNQLPMDMRTEFLSVKDCASNPPASSSQEEEDKQEQPAKEETEQEDAQKEEIEASPGAKPDSSSVVEKIGSSSEVRFLSTKAAKASLVIGNTLVLLAIIYIGAKVVVGKGPRKGQEYF